MRFLFTKTNQVERYIRSRGVRTALTVDDLKRLHRRYIIMAQVLNSIEPPPGKRDMKRLILEAVELKMRATNIFERVISGDRRPLLPRRGIELNHRGNQLIREVREAREKG